MKKLRVDVLVYVLWDLVLPDIMQDHLRAKVELKAKALSKAERQRRDVAYAYTRKSIYYTFTSY
jgi:hypothetical protein